MNIEYSLMNIPYIKYREGRFNVFHCYCDVWTNFLPLPKFDYSHVLSSRIFIHEKERLDAAIRNGPTKNFELTFLEHFCRNVALNTFLFQSIQLCARETTSRPEKPCFWDGMNLSLWVYVWFPSS